MECPATSCVVRLHHFCQGRVFTIRLGFLGIGSRIEFLMVSRVHFYYTTIHDVMGLWLAKRCDMKAGKTDRAARRN
jgi:hypothetical protein